jgi:hypothetical protein
VVNYHGDRRSANIDMASAVPNRTAPLALGLALARRGALAKVSMAVAALTLLGALFAALLMARRAHAPLDRLPAFTVSALAWGAGVMLAFAAAARALRRDRAEGVRALLVARGGTVRSYLWARVGGLAALLAIVVAGGALFAGVVSSLLARSLATAALTLQSTGAALAYGLGFAATVAPIALATLGARSRAGGYLSLVAVLILPELLRPWLSHAVPDWGDLLSLPGALSALRLALMPPGWKPELFARAAFVLAVAAAVAVAAVRAEIARVDEDKP